jgi:hypothetical protein
MLAARAWENGAFLAVANKCGSEAGIARYGGRSAIFGPSGDRVAEAGADDPEIVVADIDLREAPGPPIEVAADPTAELSRPVEPLPISRALAEPPPVSPWRLALAREGVEPSRILSELRVDIAIGRRLPSMPQTLSVDGGAFRLGDRTYRSGDIVACGPAALGLLSGERGADPEPMRMLMLGGANVVIWDRRALEVPEFVLRTRADENRVFLVTLGEGDRWDVHSPTGALVGTGPVEGIEAVYVELPLALAWQKEMAPGTDIVRDRFVDDP